MVLILVSLDQGIPDRKQQLQALNLLILLLPPIHRDCLKVTKDDDL